MKAIKHSLTLASALCLLATSAVAEIELPKPSAKSSVTQRIGLTDVTVDYFSPAVNNRVIWGELVPYDQVWRTGANDCTKFKTSKDIKVSGSDLKAGEYCLFTIPSKKDWTVVFSKDSKQWGAFNYDKSKDVLRINVTPEDNEQRERLTFLFTDTNYDRGNLRLEWEKIALNVPIEVNTREQALTNIKNLKSKEWIDYAFAAQYQLEDAKNPVEAKKLIDQSITLQKTWFNNFIKARVAAEQGDKGKARELASESLKMDDKSDFFKFYKPRIEEQVNTWSQG
jgi:hypothetical protein